MTTSVAYDALNDVKTRLLIYIIAFFSMSNVTIKNVTGTSYWDSTNKKIYAGVAGRVTQMCASTSADSTCDTCADTGVTGLTPCNPKSIHSNLLLNITFSSSVDLTGKPIGVYIGTSKSSNTQVGSSVNGSTASSDMTLSLAWSNYCNAVGLTGCDPSAASSDQTYTQHFYIGADEDLDGTIEEEEKNQVDTVFQAIIPTSTVATQNFGDGAYGFIDFKVVSADGKLAFDEEYEASINPSLPSGYPSYYGTVLFAYQQDSGIDGSSITTGGAASREVKAYVSATDLTLTGDAYIGGLENYKRYCVFAGQQNLTQNIFGFTTTNLDDTKMCGSPSEILGLLQDKRCFISTAAFGSVYAKEVETFRNFRDVFLKTNQVGSAFVEFYYQYGAIAAKWIEKSEVSRMVVRGLLYPFYFFAWISLQWGIETGFLFLGLGLVGLFYLRKKWGQIFFKRHVL